MPWPHCSRTVSRKSRANPALVILFLLTAAALPAELRHETNLAFTPNYVSVNITLSGADVETVFDTLQEGLRVRLEYRIRISYSRLPPFRFLGNRLIREFRSAYEARWDPFLSEYVLSGTDRTRASHDDEAALYADLFALRDYRIPWSLMRSDRDLVMETSAELTPVVFVPGLSILSLFPANRSETSAWDSHALVSPSEGE